MGTVGTSCRPWPSPEPLLSPCLDKADLPSLFFHQFSLPSSLCCEQNFSFRPVSKTPKKVSTISEWSSYRKLLTVWSLVSRGKRAKSYKVTEKDKRKPSETNFFFKISLTFIFSTSPLNFDFLRSVILRSVILWLNLPNLFSKKNNFQVEKTRTNASFLFVLNLVLNYSIGSWPS